MLRQLVEATSASTGTAFFEALALNLPRALGARHAFVGELTGEEQRETRTLAVCWDGELGEPFTYALDGTPCEAAIGLGELAYYPQGVADLFPRDEALRTLGIDAYMGTPLRATDGSYLGMLVVLDSKPLEESAEPASILRIFADRAAAELQRMHDEKRLREAHDRLRHAQKMEALGRFASAIVHDFNNLLMAIDLNAGLAITKDAAGTVRHELREVVDASDRGSKLLRRLLAFAREQPIAPTALVVDRAIEKTLPLLSSLLGAEVELGTELLAPAWAVAIDPIQLDQVLMNLAINAGDAMERRGSLGVTTRAAMFDAAEARERALPRSGDYVVVEVRDTGIGMSRETLERACEPFFTTKGPDKGTGLGLATCHGIVTQAGGGLWMTSELGVGTRVTFALPRCAG